MDAVTLQLSRLPSRVEYLVIRAVEDIMQGHSELDDPQGCSQMACRRNINKFKLFWVVFEFISFLIPQQSV